MAVELDRLGETDGWNALFGDVGACVQTLAGLMSDGLDGPEAQATLARLLGDRRDDPLPFGQLLAGTAADLVREHFKTEELRLLAAPWPLHSSPPVSRRLSGAVAVLPTRSSLW